MTSIINGGGLTYQHTNLTRVELASLRRDVNLLHKEFVDSRTTSHSEIQNLKGQVSDLKTVVQKLITQLNSTTSSKS